MIFDIIQNLSLQRKMMASTCVQFISRKSTLIYIDNVLWNSLSNTLYVCVLFALKVNISSLFPTNSPQYNNVNFLFSCPIKKQLDQQSVQS